MAHSHNTLDPLSVGLFFLHLELEDLACYLDEAQHSDQVSPGDLTEALTRYAWLLTLRALIDGQAPRGVA